MRLSKFDLRARILCDTRPLLEFNHSAIPNCALVEGKEGQEYGLEISNNSNRRVFCVVSINGVSIMSGEPASKDEREGLIIGPTQRIFLERTMFGIQERLRFAYPTQPESLPLGKIGVVFFLIFDTIDDQPPDSFNLVNGYAPYLDGADNGNTIYRSVAPLGNITFYYLKPIIQNGPSQVFSPLHHIEKVLKTPSLPPPFPCD